MNNLRDRWWYALNIYGLRLFVGAAIVGVVNRESGAGWLPPVVLGLAGAGWVMAFVGRMFLVRALRPYLDDVSHGERLFRKGAVVVRLVVDVLLLEVLWVIRRRER